MKVRTPARYGGLPANFAYGELLEIHYDKLDENDGRLKAFGSLKLPFDKNSKVTGIDGGHVIGTDNHPMWNIIEKRAIGTGKLFNVNRGYGYIETEKFGDLIAYRVRFTGQPTRGSIFSPEKRLKNQCLCKFTFGPVSYFESSRKELREVHSNALESMRRRF